MPVVLEFGREHPSRGGVDGVHARAVAQTPGDVWLIQEPLRRYSVWKQQQHTGHFTTTTTTTTVSLSMLPAAVAVTRQRSFNRAFKSQAHINNARWSLTVDAMQRSRIRVQAQQGETFVNNES